jgi:hypothetical protein
MDREYVIMHNTNVIVHFQTSELNDWSGEDVKGRPKVVRRGVFDIEDEIEDGMDEIILYNRCLEYIR